MPPRKSSVEDILKKYGARIESQIQTSDSGYSSEYTKFKDELSPELTRYEKLCRSLGSFIRLNISEKDKQAVSSQLRAAHVDVEPWQALNLAVMSFVFVFVLGILISIGTVSINGDFASFPFLFFLLTMILATFLFYFMKGYPARLANRWRLKASSQMVPAILYIVIYMRHTPNLEKAIAFASENLQPPLALDFKKVFYDVEIGKFSSIKDSLDNYLENWRGYSTEFIEAFHLIESSLFEPDNSRRIITLEKALQVVLDGIYDKMLKFTHTVRSPLTNVYMLGVVLPTLALALLPLASAMLGGILTWVHVVIIFNLIIPFFVFYLTDKIMFLRPGGHGETSLLERHPLYKEYSSKKHYVNTFILSLPLLVIGLLPLIFQFTPIPAVLGLQKDYTFSQLGLNLGDEFGSQYFFGFADGKGPFGVGALILGMFFPLGIAMFFSIAHKDKTRRIILERRATKELEEEFNNSLFQLGNRIGNGMPPELAFGKVAESSKGLRTEEFFKRVNYNVRQMGMSVESSLFDKARGVLIYYPSELISSSMKILVESSKKGLKIAASSLMSISEYVKNIQKINLRLQDMLAEIVSDMKSNMAFLAPLLSGIVVGLSAMITTILSKLAICDSAGATSAMAGLDLCEIFDFTTMIPPYFLQISIGIYLIQIIFILTRTLVTVDYGEDRLERSNQLAGNLKSGILLYFLTALFATMALFILASIVLTGMAN
ncbi:MAG: hypothetical protein AABW51_01135 [Nanoarchaeota archaeon]|mgnify:CR=1 FL=1